MTFLESAENFTQVRYIKIKIPTKNFSDIFLGKSHTIFSKIFWPIFMKIIHDVDFIHIFMQKYQQLYIQILSGSK